MNQVVRAAAVVFGRPKKQLRDAVSGLESAFRDYLDPSDDAELCFAAFVGFVAVHLDDDELPELVEGRTWTNEEWHELGQLLLPMFDRENERVEDLVGGWALLGGMAQHHAVDLAVAYKRAGDELVDALGNGSPTWETVYPILFLYRHAAELAMKVDQPQQWGHNFDKLAQAHPKLHARSAGTRWARLKFAELHAMDPAGTAFRYGIAAKSQSSERLVSLRHIRVVVTHLLRTLGVPDQ